MLAVVETYVVYAHRWFKFRWSISVLLNNTAGLCVRVAAFNAILVAVGMSAASASNASTNCDFLSAERVAAALPQHAPWKTTQGTVGMCGFEGTPTATADVPATLLIIQMVKGSAREATDFTRQTKTAMASEQAMTPVVGVGVGAESFFYRSRGAGSAEPMFWYAHADKVVLSGMLIGMSSGRDVKADVATVVALAAPSLAASVKPAQIALVAKCTHFDEPLLVKILAGKVLKVQQFGDDSCMANNEASAVVMFSRVNAPDAVSLSQMRESAMKDRCTRTPLPALGAGAFIHHACADGAPRATVFFVKGLSSYDFTLTPNKEPTPTQRADLAALALRAYSLR